MSIVKNDVLIPDDHSMISIFISEHISQMNIFEGFVMMLNWFPCLIAHIL